MKKHLFLTALVLALVMCFSCGALATEIESGYINDYEITGLDEAVIDGNVTIMTVGQWKEASGSDAATFFDGGEAINDDDIIVMNKEAAIVLAVGTRNPWGYPNGSVLDAGVVKDGAGYRDTTWSIEFLANWWDSWAPGNGCDTVEFAIDEYDFDGDGEKEVAVKVTRIYDLAGNYGAEGQNNDKFLEIVTYYGAPQEGSYLYMFDGIENKGDEAVWYNGYEGYTGYQGTADGYENIAFSVTNKGDDGAATYGKGMAFPAVGSYANTIGKEGHEDFQGQYLTAFCVPAGEFTSNLGNTFAISGNGGKSGGSKGMTDLKRRCPAELPEGMTQRVQELAVATFKALGCLGVARIDFLNDKETGELWVNEINTIPGSLSFYLWQEVGVSFADLMDELVNLAFKRQREREALTFTYESNILSGTTFGTKGCKGKA